MRPWLILFLALVAACGPSPQQQAADERDRAGSWAATIRTVIDAWAAGQVPRRYVDSTLDAAADDLVREEPGLRKAAGDSVAAPLDAVMRAIPRISDAVAQGNRRAAQDAAAALSAAVPAAPPPPSARQDAG